MRSSALVGFVVFMVASGAIAAPLRGTVRDSKSGAPLAGVSVYVIETGAVAITGDDGSFELADLSDGTWHVVAIDPAYERQEKSVTVTRDSTEISSVELSLTSPLVRSEEVVVEVDRETHVAGGTTLKREEVTRVPGARGDLLTTVKSLPGVANNGAFGPQAGGLIIRGSSPQDSKILVDGFEIPILYHFGSIQSVLPSEMIDDMVYEPGGFGVENGRATGGIVSVTSRQGAKSYGGFAELSFINGGAFAQGPIGESGSFAVAARRSLVDLVLPAVLPSDGSLSFTTLPHYYDFQSRADYSPADHHRLGLFLFGTSDALELATTTINANDPSAANRFKDETCFQRAIASWTYDTGEVFNRLAVSALNSQFRFELGSTQHVQIGTVSGIVRDEVRYRAAPWIKLIGGGELELARFDVSLDAPRAPREGDPRMPNFTIDPSVQINEKPTAANIAGWVGVEVRPIDALRITPGLRVDSFTRKVPQEVVFEPRVQASLELAEGTLVRGSAGYYARPPVNDENLQRNLESERAIQTTLGLEQSIFSWLSLQLTSFYTDRSNLITYRTTRADSGNVDNTYVNGGSGRTYGSEAMIKARTSRFFGWIAYTLSRSERKDSSTADTRLFDYDQTHNLVLVSSLKLGDENQWQIGARFQYTTGRPYTPVLGATYQSDANVFDPQFGRVNSARYPAQHQLDVRVDRIWAFDSWKLSAYVDISNVYMHAAVVDYDYNYDYTKLNAFKNLPILPAIGLRGEF